MSDELRITMTVPVSFPAGTLQRDIAGCLAEATMDRIEGEHGRADELEAACGWASVLAVSIRARYSTAVAQLAAADGRNPFSFGVSADTSRDRDIQHWRGSD